MSEDNKLVFEQDDYYGPSLELTIDCSSNSTVLFSVSVASGNNITAEVGYVLYMEQEVDEVIAELTAWRERFRERLGR